MAIGSGLAFIFDPITDSTAYFHGTLFVVMPEFTFRKTGNGVNKPKDVFHKNREVLRRTPYSENLVIFFR